MGVGAYLSACLACLHDNEGWTGLARLALLYSLLHSVQQWMGAMGWEARSILEAAMYYVQTQYCSSSV